MTATMVDCIAVGFSILAVIFSCTTMLTGDWKFYVPTVLFGLVSLAFCVYRWFGF